MKGQFLRIFALAASFSWSILPATGQGIQAQHGIASGEGNNKASEPYTARTPYTLRWRADSKYKLYGKEYPTVTARDTWTTATVTDADTGRVICTSPRVGMSGELLVPVAGKHRVTINALGKWTADFTEDITLLKEAAKRGELKSGVILEEARKTSLRTKNETVETRKLALLKEIAGARESIGEVGVQLLSADAVKAAHLASSASDFDARFNALSSETVKRIASLEKIAATSDRPPSSQWNGKGLPPGMQPKK